MKTKKLAVPFVVASLAGVLCLAGNYGCDDSSGSGGTGGAKTGGAGGSSTGGAKGGAGGSTTGGAGGSATGGAKGGNAGGSNGGSAGGAKGGSAGGSAGSAGGAKGGAGGSAGGSGGSGGAKGGAGGANGGNAGGANGGNAGGANGGNAGGANGGNAGGANGGSAGGAIGGAGGSGAVTIPTACYTTGTTAISATDGPALTAEQWCMLYLSACSASNVSASVTGADAYSSMGPCTSAFTGVSAANKNCRSYHLCAANGAYGAPNLSLHCPHTIGQGGFCSGS